MSVEQLVVSTEFQEVDITYSEQVLLDKLANYQLKPEVVCKKLTINLSALAQVENSEQFSNNTYLAQLGAAIKNWPEGQDFTGFTVNTNQLIFLWLNATQDGVSIKNILNLLQSFELKSTLGFSNSAKLHCFLFDLVAETIQQYQKTQLDYALNYDANTYLPESSQILSSLENIVKNANDHQFISIFSLHFQLSKNNPIFSQLISIGLSKKIAELLQKNIPPQSQLYYGGNLQFDILLPDLSGEIQLNLLAAKLHRVFEELLFVGNQSVLVTPFIGCALNKKTTENIYGLYNSAKLALESALYNQQSLVVYTELLNEQLSAQHELENKVTEAFASDSLTLFFQPIVNLKDSSCAGAELLLRWSERAGYSVHPGLTVEILNKVGKGKLFTRWLINSACRCAAELEHHHNLKVYLTINLRAEDLHDAELPHMLMQALALWKITAKNIVLEITESGMFEYNESTNGVINQLAANGFRLALDDFGTGFSSLSRLRTMPIDLIKIDQSFVRDITRSKDDFEIVKSIAMLSASLGKEVLAEGVEDKDCLDLIKKLKIDKCQGYYYAKPMAFEQFIAWAKKHKAPTLN
jgi:EAL domain-containing protein (putative c-di-GMP-specific phosphodiesterase class I)/GGDEF domain-containing protein